MKILSTGLKLAALLLLGLAVFTGCESTDAGGSGPSTSVYYGVGFYDPWYYGDYHDDGDIVVTPPARPDRPIDRPHPEQPIARPSSPSASTRPAPSIPSAPRPAARPAGRR
jgi:hypothetical protein